MRSLALDHEDMHGLREVGVVMAGIDERAGPVKWGEGYSNTTLLFMVLEGTTTSLAENPSTTVNAGECLIVPAGCAKVLELKRGQVRAIWLHLANRERWAHLCGLITKREAIECIPLAYAAMERLFVETLGSTAGSGSLRLPLASTLLALLDIHFGAVETPTNRRVRSQLNHLWSLVSADLSHDWSAESLAARMHVSVGHLHRIVREFEHSHPMQIVTRMRMQRAAGLLRTTEYPLDQIAEAVGYGSAYAFSAAFLRQMGTRPGAYRSTCVID
ncbi:MAG: helix-turn-helix transcriptional regulator [Verrucomicrobiota bacterium]|nr:helix-turn-helix transcriptional regulator [Verrucomicrobiota bacterium]